MTEFVGPDGRAYAAIPMDLYAEVAEEEAEQEVPEEEYDAEAVYVAWTALSEEEHIARISAAQAALDTLPGNERAIMERIVLVTANARAGLHEAAQRTRQYFSVGDEVIADGKAHGATFGTDHFESLLFAMDDQLANGPSITPTQLEECDAVVLGHTAVLTTGGTPIMPDSFADSGNVYRTPIQSVGRFGVMTRDLDDEGNLRFGPFLWRNFRVAWRRYGPLVLLGLGWLWNPIYTRAEIVREMMAGTGAPTPVRRLARRRGLFWTAASTALTLLLLTAFVLLTLFRGDLSRFVDSLGHGLTSGSGGQTNVGNCLDCPTVTAALPTASGGAFPTATSGTGGCGSSCGSDSTATPTPRGPTPTPVPTQPSDVYASSATITFARASMSASSPITLTASDGSANNPGVGTQRGQKISGSADGSDGTQWSNSVQNIAASASVLKVTIVCNAGVNGCLIPSGTRVRDQSGGAHDCFTLDVAAMDAGFNDFPRCQEYASGPVTSGQVNFMFATVACSGSCSAQSGAVTSTIKVGNNAYTNYYAPSNCTGQGQAGAASAATTALNSALNGGLGTVAIGLQSSITQYWCAYPGNCSQSVSSGQQMTTSRYIVCATVKGWKFTINLGDSSGVQTQRISAPSGYAVDGASVHGCTPSIQSIDVANVRATVACQAQATAYYNVDQAMMDGIRTACAGKTLLEAMNYVNGLIGVKASSTSLSFSPSNANRLPQSASGISVTPHS